MVEHPHQAMDLEDQLQQRLRQLVVIAELGNLAMANPDLSDLMDAAVQMVSETLEVGLCKVLELEPDGKSLLLKAGIGWQEGLVGQARVGTGLDSQAGYTLVSPHPIRVEDLRTETRFSGPPLLHDHGVISGLSVVIGGVEKPYGVLGAHTTTYRDFTPNDLNFLHSIANVLAAAIDRQAVETKLRALNQTLESQVADRTRLIRLLQEATVAANEADSVADALQATLARICAYTGWPVGHACLTHNGAPDMPASSSLWFLSDPHTYEPFREMTEEMALSGSDELPARVLASGQPEWDLDLASNPSPRMKQALSAGLQAGCAFPVVVGGDLFAVLEFYAGPALNLDPALEEALANIGRQVGRVIAHQQAEEELQESQQRLSEAQQIARLGSWSWEIASNHLTWSDTLYDIYGLDPHHFKASYEAFLERVHPADQDRVADIIEAAYNQPTPFEFTHRIVRPDGGIRTLQARGKVLTDGSGKAIRMVGTGQDITERKQIEEQLHARQELLRSVVTGAPIILWAVDRQGQITLVEGKGLASLDLDGEDYLGTSIYDQIQNNPEVGDYVLRAMAGEEVTAEVATEEAIFETRYAPMIADDGEVIGVTGVSIDISERRRAEAARRESEARFRTIFDSGPLGIAMIDLDGQFMLANPALQTMLAVPEGGLTGRQIWDLTPAPRREATRARLQPLLDGAQISLQWEEPWARDDGPGIWVNLSLALVRNPDDTPRFVIAMAKDITFRKKMEAELAEVQRQLIVSREKERLLLAQEIHDEPLQDLYGLLYQLETLRTAEPVAAAEEEIVSMDQRLHRVINTLRAICGELRPPTLAPFGLEGALREHAERFQESHRDIQVQLDLMYDGQSLPEHQRLTLFRIYQQALSNVTRHARAGQVAIRFRFDQTDVVLEVEDDGVGFTVPERWVEMVRENHFGLAGAAERLEMVDGHLEVRSAPGQGTLVRATVPRLPMDG